METIKIELFIKEIIYSDGKGKALARYDLILDGTTVYGNQAVIRGVRLFKKESDGVLYIQLPRVQASNSRYINVINLPKDVFRRIEQHLVEDYKSRYNV